MTSPIGLEQAALAYRAAARETLQKHRFWYLLQAALMIIGGVVAILTPLFSSLLLVLMLGWLLIISGGLQAISLIGAGKVPSFWMQLISAALAVIVGILILGAPAEGLFVITLLLIAFLMTEGIAKIVLALTIRPMSGWGWIAASGILGLVLSGLLWSSLPGTAGWLLAILFGVQLISEGAALGATVLAIGRSGTGEASS